MDPDADGNGILIETEAVGSEVNTTPRDVEGADVIRPSEGSSGRGDNDLVDEDEDAIEAGVNVC